MRNVIILLTLFCITVACKDNTVAINPLTSVHSGAKQAPVVEGLEDWGGITLQSDHSNEYGDYYYGFWAKIPIKVSNISFENVQGYGAAWGQLVNYNELRDMAVNGSIETNGKLELIQSHLGDNYGEMTSSFRASSDATNEVVRVSWYGNGSLLPVLRDKIAESLSDLEDQYRQNLDAAEFFRRKTKLDEWIDNNNRGVTTNTIITDNDEFSWLIEGRIVKKPDGDFGIVPPLWIPPQ